MVWKFFFNRRREHAQKIVVTPVGVRRSFCETCGHLSFSISPNLMLAVDKLEQRQEEDLARVAEL
jgi:hypothetical protein